MITGADQFRHLIPHPPRKAFVGNDEWCVFSEIEAIRSMKEKQHMTQTDPNMESKQNQGQNYQEELQVMGEQLVSKVKELLHEGNVRRIIIKQDGHSIMEFPLTVGLVGVIMAPALAALGAIGALMAQCSIEVVRSERPSETFQSKVEDITNE